MHCSDVCHYSYLPSHPQTTSSWLNQNLSMLQLRHIMCCIVNHFSSFISKLVGASAPVAAWFLFLLSLSSSSNGGHYYDTGEWISSSISLCCASKRLPAVLHSEPSDTLWKMFMFWREQQLFQDGGFSLLDTYSVWEKLSVFSAVVSYYRASQCVVYGK